MNSKILKRIFLTGIKYGPSMMALTCCIKIHLLSNQITESNEQIVHYINLFMDLGYLGMFYIAGKYFNYCWKHQSLCRIAMWGYIYYFIFEICNTPHVIIHPLAIWYVIFVVIITILYKVI